MSKLRGSVLSDPGELERLLPEWTALLERSDCDVPTLHPLWLLAWWRVFGRLDGRRLRVLLIHDAPAHRFSGGVAPTRLVGIAPLLSRRHWYRPGVPFRRLELLASGEPEEDEICSEQIGILAERGLEEAVADSLVAALTDGRMGAWDELVLTAMDGTRLLPARLCGALNHAGLSAKTTVLTSAPYIPLPATFADYLGKLPSASRYLATRSLREAEKWAGGPLALTVVEHADQLEEGKRILTALHRERWCTSARAGVFQSPRFAAFHDAVMPALLARGALELAWVSVRGEPIAALYNIVWNGKVYFYQSGRKLDLPEKIRPGIVAHLLAIQRSIALGRREYDFLGGATQYKMKLALATRPVTALRAVRSPLLERARLLAEAGIASLRALRDAAKPGADP